MNTQREHAQRSMKETDDHNRWIVVLVPSIYRILVLLVIVLLHVASHAVTALSVSPALTTKTRDALHLKGVIGHHHSVLWMAGNGDAVGDNGDEDASFILEKEYELTEQMVTQRGEIEEILMADSVTHPILPNEPAAPAAPAAAIKQQRGFGGGFGSTAKNQKKRKNSKKDIIFEEQQSKLEEAKDHAKVLKNEGLVRIDRILSDSVTDTLRDFVYGIRMTEGNKLKATSMQAKFPTIRRWDLSIPLFEYDDTGAATKSTTIAYQALSDVLQTTVVGETMSRFLGTDDAELYELSSYISDPGSTRQVIHSDTPCFGTDDNQPILCTCFIALQDVRVDMGPTIWLPKTNTYEMHDLFFREDGEASTPMKDQFLQTHSSVVGVIPKGSCVLFDSRLLHCGTANKSLNDSRALLFFSFQHPNINLFNPGGDIASIRPDLKGRFRLSDFVRADE